MKTILIILAITAALLTGGYFLLDYATNEWHTSTVQEVRSADWIATVTQKTHTGSKQPGSSMLSVRRTDETKKHAAEVLGVLDAPKIELQWTKPNSLIVTCNNCSVFLHNATPPGVQIIYRVTDPDHPGERF